MKVEIERRFKNPKRKRKVSIRVNNEDVDSLFSTLSKIICPCLKRFLKKVESPPWDVAPDDWKAILSKMIWSFQQINSRKEIIEGTDYAKRVDEGFELFGKWYRDLWY